MERSSSAERLSGYWSGNCRARVASFYLYSDQNDNAWILHPSVTIPLAGQITVTATCQTLGAISAPAGTITSIQTIVPSWQTVTNPTAATPGAPVESDAKLRTRQTISTGSRPRRI
jgi:uncharacterized phage protein gp47/JayE